MFTEGSPFSVAILLLTAGIGGEPPLSSCNTIDYLTLSTYILSDLYYSETCLDLTQNKLESCKQNFNILNV